MVDIYKPKKIEGPHIDAIHGHTCIELKDVKTGKRERIESDNIVTDGAEYLLKSLGTTPCGIRASETPLHAILFGGIYLFDMAIPTSPTPAKYMPAGTKMVGNGSYRVSNSSEVTEMGSFNVSESSASRNQIVQVYDYSTQQANGTIASVCLGTRMGGYMGYGNSSSNERLETLKDPVEDFYFDRHEGYGTWPSRYDYARGYYNNKFLMSQQINSDTTEFYIYEYDVPARTISSLIQLGTKVDGSVYTAVPITISAPGVGMIPFFANDKIVYVQTQSIAPNQTMKVIVVDLANNYAVSTYNVTNTTSKTWNADYMQDRWAISSDGTKIYVRADTNGVQYYEVIYSTGVIRQINITTTPPAMKRLTDDLFWFSHSSYYENQYPSIYDPVNDTLYQTNGVLGSGGGEYFGGDMDLWLRPNGFYLVPNCLRLMTINNLSSVVQKDATKTMKVTYTLTMA